MSLPRHALQVTPARRVPRPAVRRVTRDTGPSDLTRIRVYELFRCCCAACGRSIEFDLWRSLQHRVARGVGGDNDLTNLIVLCGSSTSTNGCHSKAESRDEDQHRMGYWLRVGEDPAAVPVFLVTEFRSRWVLITHAALIDYEPDDPDDPRWARPLAV